MNIKERYNINKTASVGEELICPSCNSKFVKTNYQQVFCKTKTGTICKDKYWNTVTPNKRNNTTRLSPANLSWSCGMSDIRYARSHQDDEQRRADRQDRYENYLDANSSDHGDVSVERCEFCGYINCRCED
jgi:hypothetical protein